MRQHASKRNRRSNQRIQLLITTDRKLEMTGGDTLNLKVLGSVAGKFEDFGGQVFQDGSDVDGSLKKTLVGREIFEVWQKSGSRGSGTEAGKGILG